jgi:activator of 2-hydroxyglutaryl-CoA dehydratase
MDGYLGVDVGSVTAKCAIITEVGELIADNLRI